MTVTVKKPEAASPATVLLVLCPPLGRYTDMKRGKTFEAGVDYTFQIKDGVAAMNEEIEPGRYVFDVSPNEKVLPGRVKVLPPPPKETLFVPTPEEGVDAKPPADPEQPPAPVVPPADPVVPPADPVTPPSDEDAVAL